jgi:uracil-DNA glycosylase
MFRLQPAQTCIKCGVGKAYKTAPIQVFGQSNCKPQEVKLIVIGTYPGGNDKTLNLSFAPNPAMTKKQENMLTTGGGAYLRKVMHALFKERIPDIADYIYFTNAIKCMPVRQKEGAFKITTKHLQDCVSLHLSLELLELPPNVPILLTGSLAVNAVFPDLKGGAVGNRNTNLYYRAHPVIVTMHPLDAERGHLKHVVNSETINHEIIATKLRYGEVLFGSRPWLFVQDLKRVRELVYENEQSLSSTTTN